MVTQVVELSNALSSLVGQVGASLVSVRSHRSRSTGFVWRPGLIITADEALADEGDVEIILAGGASVAAQIAGRDAGTDIALLRVQRSDLAPVSLAGAVPSVGALAMTVGSEEGAPLAALGVVAAVSGPWRSLRGGEIDARIDLDVRQRRTGEGGLALDAAGQAFGMMVFGPRRQVLVIPTATIERVGTKLETHGRIPRGYLGLSLQPVAVEGGGSGAMIVNLDPNGPGAAVGLHQGDVVVAWNGEPVGRLRPLLRTLGPDSVGQTVTLGLRRAGQPHQVALQIGERPVA
jgi:S1-C subfamily serine protease